MINKQYCIMSDNPLFYIASTNRDMLASDYEFITTTHPFHVDKILGIDSFNELETLSAVEFRQKLDAIKGMDSQLDVYTMTGEGISHYKYAAPLYVYPKSVYWDLPTYAVATSIVADYYSLNKDEFEDVVNKMVLAKTEEDAFGMDLAKNFPDTLDVGPNPVSFTAGSVLGYLCIPIVATTIPLPVSSTQRGEGDEYSETDYNTPERGESVM